MSGFHVLGIDPGFASVGFAVCTLGAQGVDPVHLGVIRTQKSDAKRKVRASEDNLERAREIAEELENLIRERQVKVVCAETMSFPRNAGAAAKMAMCWGVIAALVHRHNLAVCQASPQEVKKAVCGIKTASKEQIQDALKARWPALRENVTKKGGFSILRGVPPSQHEHAFDALAVVEACKDSDVLLLARRMAPCADSTG